MRLSDRVAAKVELALAELPIMEIERNSIDYEMTPAVAQGGDGMVTVFYIAIFAPGGAGIDDHVTFGEFLQDPYQPQEVVNTLVRQLYDQVVEEQERTAKTFVPEEHRTPTEVRSSTGLLLPGKTGHRM